MKSKTIVLGIVLLSLSILAGIFLPAFFQERPRRSRESSSLVMSGEVVQSLPDGAVLNASMGARDPVGLVFVKGATGAPQGSAWQGEVLPAGTYDNYTDPTGKKIRLMQYLVSK